MIKITKKSIRDKKIVDLDNISRGSWINLINPNEKELEFVVNKTKVSRDFLDAALDENERPRIDIEKDVLIIFRVPCKTEENSGKEMVTLPIGIIITRPPHNIITVSLKQTEVLNEFYENKVENFFTTKRTRFLIQILSRINYYFMSYLDKIENQIDRTEESLMKSMRNEDVIGLFELQKTLIYFNRAILANGIVLDNILKGKVVTLFEEDEDILDDIIIENQQSLEMTTTYYNILNNTIAAYSSLVSNNLNVVMKLLTSLTIIMSIPTIVASLYGMNVTLPFEKSPFGFAFALLISFLFSIIVAILFIKKKYL